MYGYVKPFKPELKIREYERYRACYCGLCHLLRKRYGFAARWLVSYDMAFLLMLMSEGDFASERSHSRCPASPFKKKCFACGQCAAGDIAADLTVIFSRHKLLDNVRDKGFISGLPARLALIPVGGMYRRAAVARPETAAAVSAALERLTALEEEKCPSVDRVSDAFGDAGEAAALAFGGDRQDAGLLRSVFRLVYLLDAVDDLEEDMKKDDYNVIALRFNIGVDKPLLTPEAAERLIFDTDCLLSEAAKALDGMPLTEDSPILDNIVRLGIPDIRDKLIRERSGNRDG